MKFCVAAEILIRDVRSEDVPSLIALCVEHAAYEGSSCGIGPDEGALRAALFGDRAPLLCRVAESGGRIVGYATATREFSTWQAAYYLHMDCLYLTPCARGMRMGQRLMRSLAQCAQQYGCTSMEWQTPIHNTRALSFYRRVGATEEGKLRFRLNGVAFDSLAGSGVAP